MENKKAQGMSTSTVILLILGLVILVVLILGFSMGWQKFAPWLSKNNVDAVKTACEVACSTGSTYSFCTVEREVVDEGEKLTATCEELATDYSDRGYGVLPCSKVDCS